VFVML